MQDWLHALVWWTQQDRRVEEDDMTRTLTLRQWLRTAVHPYCLVHVVAVVGVAVVDFHPNYPALTGALYLVMMFGITAGYHRYFSHRTFKTSRPVQFAFAVLGNLSCQKSPLWWAAHHRHHHRFSDEEEDVHSPTRHGLIWSHMGWFLSDIHKDTKHELVRDLTKYPELQWMDRNPYLLPVGLAALLATFGGTGALVWGFFLTIVLVWHCTFTINSLAHVWGTRRYNTTDTSKNNFVLALLTLGEGWHNNHHRYMNSTRQGFFWWEIDVAYCILKVMSWVGLVWDIRPVPESVLRPKPKGPMLDAKPA